jgi:peptide deformylase
MKTLADLVLLGDPRLYEVCEPVTEADLPLVPGWIADLHQVMQEVRARYGFGRGIAAVLLNPELSEQSPTMFELWDDCMCFPNLLVRVQRHKAITVTYHDAEWQPQRWPVQGAVAELLQHECDHLDGILCTMRALDDQSFRWRP